MKTGFDPVMANSGAIQLTPVHVKLFSLVVLLLEYSIGAAVSFADHHGRHVVGPDDIKRAIKTEAMRFFDRPDLESQLDQVYNSLVVDMESQGVEDQNGLSDDTEDDPWVDVTLTQDEKHEESGTLADDEATSDEGTSEEREPCTCNDCHAMYDVDNAWSKWDVRDDEVKSFLKSQIDAINEEYARRTSGIPPA